MWGWGAHLRLESSQDEVYPRGAKHRLQHPGAHIHPTEITIECLSPSVLVFLLVLLLLPLHVSNVLDCGAGLQVLRERTDQ